MKFSMLVGIFAEELEEKMIDLAKEHGAQGVTILNARGIGTAEKKTFFGLTYEGRQSLLVFVLEETLAHTVLRAFSDALDLEHQSKGLVFTFPIEKLAGIDKRHVEHFDERLKKKT